MKLLSLILMAFAAAAAPVDPPGVLVDLGGRRLHVWCSGAGAPVVILEAGAGAFAIDWALVQPQIAGSNRVCSYDRAGLGWSDSGPNAGKPDAIVADLHALLAAAGLKPPYVMVGASMGGIYVRLYDLAYPGEVAGMVLVDPGSEERLFTMYQGRGVTIASLTAEQLRSTISSERVVVPRRPAQTGAPFDRLPPELYEARVALETRVISSQPAFVSAATMLASAEAERAALARLHAFTRHPKTLSAAGPSWSCREVWTRARTCRTRTPPSRASPRIRGARSSQKPGTKSIYSNLRLWCVRFGMWSCPCGTALRSRKIKLS